MIHRDRIVLTRARDDVRDALRRLIVSGEFAADAKFEEVEIATRLGVSRTPVREALIALEHEGLVRSRPNKGFVLVPADADLVRESYPILAALEAAALTLAGPHLRAALSELRALDDKLAKATRPSVQYELDHAFHRRLIRDCGNQRLLEMIETERTRAQRFDGAHRRGMADRDGSRAEHRAIIAAIVRNDIAEAARTLAAHWERGIGVVVGWLERKT